MFSINSSNNIKVIQGDTGSFIFTLEEYSLDEGDKVFLTVKETYESEAIIEKVIDSFVEGKAHINFTKEDTDIPAKTYLYDIQCSLKDGRVDTVFTPKKFQVLGGITDA